MKENYVTCSFSLDRDIYERYKSIVSANGEDVKSNIVRYMRSVIQLGIPNEVKKLKK